jgi:hypothetical protein
MFQVIPQPEFSAWYETLPEPLAEEVAASVDLAASASGALEPERLSRLLLWFDGSGGQQLDGLTGLAVEGRAYLAWHHEVVSCLDSPSFQARLAQLDATSARQALLEVERVKRTLRATRASFGHSAWLRSERATAQPVRAAFLDLLKLVGLEPKLVLGSGSGLRELTITNVRPRLRVLFGLDHPARRLIAILGESLDRGYYGDSVKRAEARWREYCAESAARTGAAP